MTCNCKSRLDEVLALLQDLKVEVGQVNVKCDRVEKELFGISNEPEENKRDGIMETTTVRQILEKVEFDLVWVRSAEEEKINRKAEEANKRLEVEMRRAEEAKQELLMRIQEAQSRKTSRRFEKAEIVPGARAFKQAQQREDHTEEFPTESGMTEMVRRMNLQTANNKGGEESPGGLYTEILENLAKTEKLNDDREENSNSRRFREGQGDGRSFFDSITSVNHSRASRPSMPTPVNVPVWYSPMNEMTWEASDGFRSRRRFGNYSVPERTRRNRPVSRSTPVPSSSVSPSIETHHSADGSLLKLVCRSPGCQNPAPYPDEMCDTCRIIYRSRK